MMMSIAFSAALDTATGTLTNDYYVGLSLGLGF